MIKYLKDDPIYQEILYVPYLKERLAILNKAKNLHPDLAFHKKYIEWELSEDRKGMGEEVRLKKEADNVKECLDNKKFLNKKPIFPIYCNIFGEKITSRLWTVLRHGPKHIARDTYKNYIVSTIWIGLHHEGGYFGTMIFSEDDSDINFTREKYYTLEEAKEGHLKALDFVHTRYVYLELRPGDKNIFNLEE